MKINQKPSKKNQNKKSESPPSQLMKAMLVFVFFFMTYSSHAQVFYGTTFESYSGLGKIFKVNGDGSGYQEAELHVSTGSNTNYTYSTFDRYKLTKSSNGKFYGTTISGGVDDNGVLFEFDPITNEYTEKMSLYYYMTGYPIGQMLEYNGLLYGTSVSIQGNIYSFNPATNSFKIEYMLPCRSPGMILHGGKFYGMTVYGGVQRAGAIFEFDPSTKTYTVLFQFDRTSSGYFPEGGLTYVNGKLYGVTTTGGKFNQGTLFEYDLTTNQFKKKIDFKADINGSSPIGDLTFHNNKLLGVTAKGGASDQGVLFEFDQSTALLSKVIDFSSEFPAGTLKLISGKLYGVATNAGTNGDGLLFSIDPLTKEYVRLFEFNGGEKGSQPFGELTFNNNALYGMTKIGGLEDKGIIFKYDLVSEQLYALNSFSYSPFGNKPICLLEVGSKFYGLTSEGGTTGKGVLFELDTATFEVTKLHDFTCDQCGVNDYYDYYDYYYSPPEGQLLVVDNKLYGIFTKAGSIKGGELFSYDLDQGNYSSLVEFNTAETSQVPVGNIAFLNGKIIGATKDGGSENNGVVFEYDIANSVFQIKQNLKRTVTGFEFRFTNADNTLYALGKGGVLGKGVLSKYDQVTGTVIPIHEFENISEGINPAGTLYFESPKLYGAIDGGGNFFEFDTQTQVYQKKTSQHYSQIRAIRNGKLYGSTGLATIFEFDLASETFQELLSIKLNDSYSGGGQVNSLIVHSGDFHTSPVTITEVIEFIQGKRKDGKPIAAKSSNPQEALGYSNSPDFLVVNEIKFVSLGYGGSITLAFDNPLYNKPGIDINIAETSYGDPSFYDYPERAEVFVSQDGAEWISLGFTNDHSSSLANGNYSEAACKGKLDSQFDMQPTELSWIKYVKVVDTTDPMAKRRDKNLCSETNVFAFNAASDGFDLDAIFEQRILYPNYVSGRSRTSENKPTMVDISAPNSTALLFPNPVANLLSINLGEEQELAIMEDEFHLEIFDTQGKAWTTSKELLDESWIINHDVSKLNPGMYIARVTNGNVRRYYKFMKK